jgi:hypothetical protein
MYIIKLCISKGFLQNLRVKRLKAETKGSLQKLRDSITKQNQEKETKKEEEEEEGKCKGEKKGP